VRVVPPLAWTDHLVALVGRCEAAAARLADADPQRVGAVAEGARREAARLSARLDASPLEATTADAVDAGVVPTAPVGAATSTEPDDAAGPSRAVGWAQALKLDGMPTQDVAAVEYANLLACFDAEPEIGAVFFDDPLAALARLHGLVVQGLVAPDVIGRPRRTAQAITDGAQGRVLYHAAEPDTLPALLDGLAAWLGTGSAALPAVVVAGVVQERLVEWQPYEAGNGRVARAASRVVLRTRGADRLGAAVPERALAADPAGYYAEVAATIRRGGDLALWLERYGEAAADGLEAAADAAAPRARPEPPPRALALAQALAPGEAVTLAEYAGRADVHREQARADLDALVAAALLRREPRTRGLRFRRV
jgi:hypothetical protein